MTRPTKLAGTLAAAGLLLALATPVSAQGLAIETVASGFEEPVYIGSPPGDTERLFLIELRKGKVHIIKNGVVLDEPFLNVSSLIATSFERGLLGMAFHPDYATNGRFFIEYSNQLGDTVVSEYAVSSNPDVAEPFPVQTLFNQEQPSDYHNGGSLHFGADGMLYIALGDGEQGDPGGEAQDLSSNLGKIVRLDVDLTSPFVPTDNPFVGVAGVNDEIWALGLRNPWRFTIDRSTGDLWIADVGHYEREEINFQPASSSGGENYGWRCMEGMECTGLSGCTCDSSELTRPIFEYDHSDGCAIIGGYVYRGDAIPALVGKYVYADYCEDKVWSLRFEDGIVGEFSDHTADLQPNGTSLDQITTFGEDGAGELYILDRSGGDVFKIVSGGCAALTYCTTSPNSVGTGAVMDSSGSTSIAANNFGVLTAGAIPEEFGLYLYGPTQAELPFGDGVQCIANPEIYRLSPPQLADSTGDTGRELDLTDSPGQFTPGSTWNFQLWYRDPGGPGGSGFNLSNGLRVLFCP